MMDTESCWDVVVVGAGIVGAATAKTLADRRFSRVLVLEKEACAAFHQTGRNSGVIHSGLYYKPGSAKALLCARGRDLLYRYAAQRGLGAQRCGKVVIATRDDEVPRLEELERRGRANGLEGVRRISVEELREREPHAAGLAALWVPQTGIVEFSRVTEAYLDDVRAQGGECRFHTRVLGVRREFSRLVVETDRGRVFTRMLVTCAGVQCDRVASACGARPGMRIAPFRGEYYELAGEARTLVRNLIYPVPDPAFPFLGVHFTRMARGGVEAGPNAVPAFHREGYRKTSLRLRDALDLLSYRGFHRLALRYGATGAGEVWRSFVKSAFVRALQRLVPEIQATDLRPGGAGVRAQALSESGALLDDFHLLSGRRAVHVLNAPSPAATASLAIGEVIAGMVFARHGG